MLGYLILNQLLNIIITFNTGRVVIYSELIRSFVCVCTQNSGSAAATADAAICSSAAAARPAAAAVSTVSATVYTTACDHRYELVALDLTMLLTSSSF